MAEMAGWVAWLLDEEIDPSERVRRHVAWRFKNIAEARYIASKPEEISRIEKAEVDLVGSIEKAGWNVLRPNSESRPRLSGPAGKAEQVPGYTEVVVRMLETRDEKGNPVVPMKPLYSFLSAAAHGMEWATQTRGAGHQRTLVEPPGTSIGDSLGLCHAAVAEPYGRTGKWLYCNSLATPHSRVIEAVDEIYELGVQISEAAESTGTLGHLPPAP